MKRWKCGSQLKIWKGTGSVGGRVECALRGPRSRGSLRGGWCGSEGTDPVDALPWVGFGLASLPCSPFLHHRNIPSFFQYAVPFFMRLCIHSFFPCTSDYLSTWPKIRPSRVSSGKPDPPPPTHQAVPASCLLPLLSHLLPRGVIVSCLHSLGNLVCLPHRQWSFSEYRLRGGRS